MPVILAVAVVVVIPVDVGEPAIFDALIESKKSYVILCFRYINSTPSM